MQCQDARRLLHELLDNDIGQASRLQLQQHLNGCSYCRDTESTLRQTVDLLEEMSRVTAPSDFTQQLLQQLPRSSSRRWSLQRVLSVAAVLLLLLVSPLYFTDTLNNPQFICRDRQALIVQEGGSYVVPPGEVVQGSITVYRHNLLVRGQVLGDVRVVDGQLIVEETGAVAGTASEQKSSGMLKMKLALAELWEDIGSWLFWR